MVLESSVFETPIGVNLLSLELDIEGRVSMGEYVSSPLSDVAGAMVVLGTLLHSGVLGVACVVDVCVWLPANDNSLGFCNCGCCTSDDV